MATTTARNPVLWAVLAVLAVLLLLPLLLVGVSMPMMGMMWGGGPGTRVGLSPLWGLGSTLLFLVVVLGAGYLLYRAVARGSLGVAGRDAAIEELRLEYARGDVSEEEFERRRERLERDRAGTDRPSS